MLVFTSCTNNYIPKARILASTLKAQHPEWQFCLLLGETPPEGFCLAEEPFDRIVAFDEIGIASYHSWLFRHRVVEICTAAKGPALYHFLVTEGHEKVLYLDPDIMVLNTLAPLEDLLDQHDVLLTPHQLAMQTTKQGVEDNELCALQHGVFNLGFVGVANRGQGIEFARWWRDRLLQYCYDDIPRGLFTDQRWCDLAPAFFSRLHIVRDHGCNAASWNLTDRTITLNDDNVFMANEGPLRFYHFTGYDSGAGTGMTARYATNMPAVHELWRRYGQLLESFGHSALKKYKWRFTSFEDGTPITDNMRLVYRSREDLQRKFPNPFRVPGYLQWYRADIEDGGTRTFSQRLFRKVRHVSNRVRHQLDMRGGFPAAIPCLYADALHKIHTHGLKSVMRSLWKGAPLGAHTPEHFPASPLPELQDMLADEAALARLHVLCSPDHKPVCMVEHDCGGGAHYYCEQRVASLLAEGRAVLRLRYSCQRQQVELNLLSGKQSLYWRMGHVWELLDPRMPRFSAVIINEMTSWHLRPHSNLFETATAVVQTLEGLLRLSRQHEAPLEILFHDFFTLCPTINLLNDTGTFCQLPDEDGCTACLRRMGVGEFCMPGWREAWGNALTQAETVVFFSENTKKLVSRIYTQCAAKGLVQPHKVHDFGCTLDIPTTGPMVIGVVGDVQLHKGASIVIELARLLQAGHPESSIVVIGNLGTSLPLTKNIRVCGHYAQRDLPRLLEAHKITVGLFPSIAPETFSYVVHELLSLNLPLVCFNLGAPADVLAHRDNCLVADEMNAESALKALCALDARRTE